MWRPDHTVQNPSHFSSSSPSFSNPIGGAAAGGSLVGAPPSPATGMAVPWSCARARCLPFSFRPPPLSAASLGAVVADSAHRRRRRRWCRSPRRRARSLECRRAAVERACIGAQARMEQRLGSSSRTRRRWHAGEPTPWLFFPRSHGRRWSSSRCVPSALSLLGLVIDFNFQLRFEIELHLVLSLFLSIRKRILPYLNLHTRLALDAIVITIGSTRV